MNWDVLCGQGETVGVRESLKALDTSGFSLGSNTWSVLGANDPVSLPSISSSVKWGMCLSWQN